MADRSAIEWTEATWPVVQGCDPVSPRCANCYAAPPPLWRLAHNPNPTIAAPLARLVEKHKDRLRFTGHVALRGDRIAWPLKWREPRRIFIPSHGDLFHKAVPCERQIRMSNGRGLRRKRTYNPARFIYYVNCSIYEWDMGLVPVPSKDLA
jgi:protein gp37